MTASKIKDLTAKPQSSHSGRKARGASKPALTSRSVPSPPFGALPPPNKSPARARANPTRANSAAPFPTSRPALPRRLQVSRDPCSILSPRTPSRTGSRSFETAHNRQLMPSRSVLVWIASGRPWARHESLGRHWLLGSGPAGRPHRRIRD